MSLMAKVNRWYCTVCRITLDKPIIGQHSHVRCNMCRCNSIELIREV